MTDTTSRILKTSQKELDEARHELREMVRRIHADTARAIDNGIPIENIVSFFTSSDMRNGLVLREKIQGLTLANQRFLDISRESINEQVDGDLLLAQALKKEKAK